MPSSASSKAETKKKIEKKPSSTNARTNSAEQTQESPLEQSSDLKSSDLKSSDLSSNALNMDAPLTNGSSDISRNLERKNTLKNGQRKSKKNGFSESATVANNIRHHTPNRAPYFQSSYQPAYQNSDRTAIFIDGSNLFYAASHLNIEVDYRRLLTTLVGNRRLLRAYFYTGVDPNNEKQRGFLLWLNRHGHRVVSKELAHMPDGSRKANMHVEMAVDMMRISEYCSTLTLLGGDGNLAYALQVLSQKGVTLEVISLQSMTSDSLIDLADVYVDLADLREDIKR